MVRPGQVSPGVSPALPGASLWLSQEAHVISTWFYRLCGDGEARDSASCPQPLLLARVPVSLWQLPGEPPSTLLAEP